MGETVPQTVGPSSGAEAIVVAQTELRSLIHRLADEVASFRGRALAAEARQRELEQLLPVDDPAATPTDAATDAATDAELAVEDAVALAARVAELELENAGLRERLTVAAERTSKLLDRTRFLRQQQVQGGEVG